MNIYLFVIILCELRNMSSSEKYIVLEYSLKVRLVGVRYYGTILNLSVDQFQDIKKEYEGYKSLIVGYIENTIKNIKIYDEPASFLSCEMDIFNQKPEYTDLRYTIKIQVKNPNISRHLYYHPNDPSNDKSYQKLFYRSKPINVTETIQIYMKFAWMSMSYHGFDDY